MQWRDFFRAETIKLIINTNEIQYLSLTSLALLICKEVHFPSYLFLTCSATLAQFSQTATISCFINRAGFLRIHADYKKSIKEPWSMKTGLLTNGNPSFESVLRGWMFGFEFITTSSPSNEQEMSTKYLFQCELYEKIRIPSFIYRKCVHCCNESSNL